VLRGNVEEVGQLVPMNCPSKQLNEAVCLPAGSALPSARRESGCIALQSFFEWGREKGKWQQAVESRDVDNLLNSGLSQRTTCIDQEVCR